ncbi:hypothetical protein SANTM175S_00438 [Streptomyces antimycoticus]
MPQHLSPALPATGAIEPEHLEGLRGDGARMAPHWAVTGIASRQACFTSRPLPHPGDQRARGIGRSAGRHVGLRRLKEPGAPRLRLIGISSRGMGP